jgi:hypothetical protein
MFDALAQLMPHGLLCSCAWPSRSSAVAVISDSRYAIPPGPENCEATGPKYRAAEELNKNRIQWLKNIWKLLFFYLHLDMYIYIYMLIVSTAPYLLTWDISIYFICQNLLPLPLIGPRRLQPATSPPLVACSNRNPPDTHEFPQRAEKFTTQENKMELYGTGRWKA